MRPIRPDFSRCHDSNFVYNLDASPVGGLAHPNLRNRSVGTAAAVNRITDLRMRILLQHKQTGLYFKDIESWVRNSTEAKDFISSTAAIDFCVTNKLREVQMVLKFEEQKYDIVMAMEHPRPHRDRPVKSH